MGGAGVGYPRVRIGITEYAQSKLGDIVFVQLPEVGGETETGESFGEVESPRASPICTHR